MFTAEGLSIALRVVSANHQCTWCWREKYPPVAIPGQRIKAPFLRFFGSKPNMGNENIFIFVAGPKLFQKALVVLRKGGGEGGPYILPHFSKV